ncbi:MAG: cell wall-binding repeat-containing protein [Coriobacteriia bacterium]|nr:cell wall-binding repeat-containing protein [Coriobacteriia bacterium]
MKMRIASNHRTGRAWRLLVALALVVALVPVAMPGSAAAAAVVYYVDAATGSDAAAGTSAAPFKTITHAMSAAVAGDTIVVRDGIYDVALGESFPIDVTRGVTVRAQAGHRPVVDAEAAIVSGVFKIKNAIEHTVLHGLTITGGRGAYGGLRIITNDEETSDQGWPRITYNRFEDNSAAQGGAIDVEGLFPGIPCTAHIIGNEFVGNNGAQRGGAVAVLGRGDAYIANNVFTGNIADDGGALYVGPVGTAVVDGNEFTGNSTDALNYGGGAVFAYQPMSGLSITDNLFQANTTMASGGAIVLNETESAWMERNRFISNSAGMTGGAMALTGSSDVNFHSNVVYGNSSGGAGGAIAATNGTVRAVGSSFAGNTSGSWDGVYAPGQWFIADGCVFWHDEKTPGDPSTVQDVIADTISLYYCLTRDTDLTGTGVIHSDPMFRALAPGDLMPMPGSPLIDWVTGVAETTYSDVEGRVRPTDGDGDGTARHDIGAFERPEPDPDRLSGDDRYLTAMAIVADTFGEAEAAVVASGENFPDALSASGLAGALGGPLVLVRRDSIPAGLITQLTGLGVRDVYLVGGEGVISPAVAGLFTGAGFTVKRVAGDDRYETSSAIAYEIADIRGVRFGDDAFVARGDDFPDALAVAPLAAGSSRPILLTRTGDLPPVIAGTITDLGLESLSIAGGTGAVSEDVEEDLEAIALHVSRLAGGDRYATAVAVAHWGVYAGLASWDHVGIASGTNFPDALAGGIASGRHGGVLLLTAPTALSPATAARLTSEAGKVSKAVVYGGPGAVTENVRSAIATALGW